MQTQLMMASIDKIDPNPHRLIGTYPYSEQKLAALMRSYADVGMWEGVIARPVGDRFQIAFGHHRVEAARRTELVSVPLVIRALDDEQMLQFMGRENLEDYSTEFLLMLEAWDAALLFQSRKSKLSYQDIDIARILGWTRTVSRSEEAATKQRKTALSFEGLTDVASACGAAHRLIEGGYLGREDLKDLTVTEARQIVERAQKRMGDLTSIGKERALPAKEIEAAKRHVGKAAADVARRAREEKTRKDLRADVDYTAFRYERTARKQTPLFEIVIKAVADHIQGMLRIDATSEKLKEFVKAVSEISNTADKAALEYLDLALKHHGELTMDWRVKLKPKLKVVNLHAVEGRKA